MDIIRVSTKSLLYYLFENLRWVVIDKRNNSSTGGFDELDVRGRNVGRIAGISVPTGGAITRMRKDSDHRSVVEQGIDFGTSTQLEVI